MSRLAGFFAGILEVSVPAEASASLFKALHELEERGLRVVVEDARGDSEISAYRELCLELVGQDRPGIVRDISAGLAAAGVNVVELSTECSSAPMSGEPLFSATARLHHPISNSVDELRETLEKIAGNLMVDISIAEAKD